MFTISKRTWIILIIIVIVEVMLLAAVKVAPAFKLQKHQPIQVQETCVVSGCSGELCIASADSGNKGITNCLWRPEYGCYKNARCERQSDGNCGWTQTAELTKCLSTFNVRLIASTSSVTANISTTTATTTDNLDYSYSFLRYIAENTAHNSSEHVYPNSLATSTIASGTIIWPEFRNINKNALDNINQALTLKNVTRYDLNEAEAIDVNGLPEILGVDYTINYDKNNLVSISFLVDYNAANDGEFTTNYSINLTNGELVKLSDIFSKTKLNSLINILNKKLQDSINQALSPGFQCPADMVNEDLQDVKSDDPNYGKFTELNLNFNIVSSSIDFIYDFDFPQADRACEPGGTISLSFNELKDYLDSNGLLGNEVK